MNINTAFILLSLFVALLGAEKPLLTLVTCEWTPYLGEALPSGGVSTEICREAFKRAGYATEIEFMDWNRALGLTESGDSDILVGCYNTKERAAVYAISDTIGMVNVVLFQRADDSITYQTMNDLKPYRVGAMRGNAYTPEFDDADYITKEYVDNMSINIKKLLFGRIDLIVGSRLVIEEYMRNNFPDKKEALRVVHPPLSSISLHIGVSRKREDFQEIVEAFDSALLSMKKDGTLKRINEKHGFEYPMNR